MAALSIAHQQMVEIIKAYRRNSPVICFDEPTAPLTDKEIDILFNLIQQLKEQGKIILYVSHRMKEIFQITDEIVVLKDGKFVTKLNTSETNEQDLIKAMVGRDIGDTYANLSRNDKYGDALLEVNNLTTYAVHDVSFKLRKGEVIGLAGLVGAGRTEVVRAIFGADAVISGEIKLEGQPVKFASPRTPSTQASPSVGRPERAGPRPVGAYHPQCEPSCPEKAQKASVPRLEGRRRLNDECH